MNPETVFCKIRRVKDGLFYHPKRNRYRLRGEKDDNFTKVGKVYATVSRARAAWRHAPQADACEIVYFQVLVSGKEALS